MNKCISRRDFLGVMFLLPIYLRYQKIFDLFKTNYCIVKGPTDKGVEFLKKHVIYSGDEKKSQVAITYDDQPYNIKNIQKVLRAYKEFNAKTTFFLIMERVALSKEMKVIIPEIIEEGHEIGFHGWDKDHPIYSKLPKSRIKEDLEKCFELMHSICPEYFVRFIRWPYGETGKLVDYAASFGLQVVNWNVESGGLDEKTKYRVVENSKNGSIVLSHLTRPYDVSQAEEIISSLHEKGYKLVNISTILRSEDIIPFTPEYFNMVCLDEKIY
ncbi:MAG: polysaccharide deacetylase family protein [Candidatus Aenigmatarchaeota archaeon]